MLSALEEYYNSKQEPLRSCLLALRHIILGHNNNIIETLKWSSPCFCFQNKMFCFIAIDKKTNKPYLLIVEGKKINHPELIQGNRKRMKIFQVDHEKDIPVKTIQEILQMAIDIYQKPKST